MPCPCGYYGALKRECRCGPLVILKYRQLTESSADIRDRVEKARGIQRERFKSERGTHTKP